MVALVNRIIQVKFAGSFVVAFPSRLYFRKHLALERKN